jgi:hypothetical protein
VRSWRRGDGGHAANASEREMSRPFSYWPDRAAPGHPGEGHQRLQGACAGQIPAHLPGLAYRDLHVRRNMTTTEWSDIYTSIAANNVLVSMEETGENVLAEEIMATFESIKEAHNKSGSTWYAVVAGPDNKMWLEHQSLPASAEALQAKPTFVG